MGGWFIGVIPTLLTIDHGRIMKLKVSIEPASGLFDRGKEIEIQILEAHSTVRDQNDQRHAAHPSKTEGEILSRNKSHIEAFWKLYIYTCY